jgi:hypothetical protein
MSLNLINYYNPIIDSSDQNPASASNDHNHFIPPLLYYICSVPIESSYRVNKGSIIYSEHIHTSVLDKLANVAKKDWFLVFFFKRKQQQRLTVSPKLVALYTIEFLY